MLHDDYSLMEYEVRNLEKHLEERGQDDYLQRLIQLMHTVLSFGRPDDALVEIVHAQEKAPWLVEHAAFQELLADCHLKRYEIANIGFFSKDDLTTAETLYFKIIDAHPNYENLGWIYYQIGQILIFKNNIGEARAYFDRALVSPSVVRTLTAYCYERLGYIAFYEYHKWQEALSFLDRSIATYPVDEDKSWLSRVYVLRSRVFREQEDAQAAIDAAETAVQLANASDKRGGNKADLSEALITAGELLFDLENRQSDAIQYLQQYLDVTPVPTSVDVTWSRIHEMLGDAFFNMRAYEMSASAFLDALKFNPYHPWEISLHYRAARSFYKLQAYAETIETIQRMLKLANMNDDFALCSRAFDMLGSAYFATRRYIEAGEAYAQAIKMAPWNAEGLARLKLYYLYSAMLNAEQARAS